MKEAALERLTAILDAFPSPAAGDERTAAAEGATRFVGAALKWCRGCVRACALAVRYLNYDGNLYFLSPPAADEGFRV